ncbi:proQ/FINO family protein [Salmonella enterica subsp. enterica serovar Uzaramo]|nr:proQ/FINO family protein [Salmonella enterica]EEE9946658.1 proQ/FINO family protein [Salmonella enterica subsp. enterica serovar Uzaramo]EBE7298513.1 proQ/FINO family protein [Salmonella enterica]EHP5748368.1 ProQ/FinO family protein [Salmonella enterica]EHP5914974.1 ProQ/FinO family protein [Salmonella enterica]
MIAVNINRKSASSQVSTWQETLQDYKTHMISKKQQQTQQGAQERDKTTSAHKVKPTSRKASQKPTSEPRQAKPKPVQERVRPERMNRRQWKNFKHMRRILALWPELFDLDSPKPLKVGVLDDIQRDIAARGLTIGAGVLKAAIASYTRRIRYKKAIAAGGARYNLNGQPCGEITPEQQQTAADDINGAKGDRDNGR